MPRRLQRLTLPVLTLLACAVVLLAVACSGDDEHSAGGGDRDLQLAAALAPIHEVEVVIAESFPPQYLVRLVSGLPNGCVEFDRYELTREGRSFHIAVWNLAPAPGGPAACTALYGLVEHTIALGSDLEPGQRYRVTVNDVTQEFQAR